MSPLTVFYLWLIRQHSHEITGVTFKRFNNKILLIIIFLSGLTYKLISCVRTRFVKNIMYCLTSSTLMLDLALVSKNRIPWSFASFHKKQQLARASEFRPQTPHHMLILPSHPSPWTPFSWLQCHTCCQAAFDSLPLMHSGKNKKPRGVFMVIFKQSTYSVFTLKKICGSRVVLPY